MSLQQFPDRAGRLPDALLVLDEREAHVAVAARTESDPRADRDSRGASEAQRELQRTDLSHEDRIAELVREKVLALTRDEVPHAITVEVARLEEKVVEADVLVETDSQKQIVIGRGGSLIKEVGVRARPEIEHLLGRHVFLELRVKVKPRWRRDEALLERLGI